VPNIAAAHFFPVFQSLAVSQQVNLVKDTLMVGLISAGTFTWGTVPYGYQYVSQFLGGDGTHGALTETSTSGTNYTRQALSGVTFSVSGTVSTLTCSNVTWNPSTFSTSYAFYYDNSVGSNDATHPILAYWDFGGSQSISGTPFTLSIASSGLVTWGSS
jgi:hypothetical protein